MDIDPPYPVVSGEARAEMLGGEGGAPRGGVTATAAATAAVAAAVADRSLSPAADGAVRLAEEKTLNSLRVKFDELWRRLEEPSGTQVTAARMARGQPIYGRGRPRTSVRRTVEKLEREGVVHRAAKGSYAFTEPLFGRYVRELTS